ncbi:type II toxin-antitoxin system HicB family antitoxin [Herbaspirillum huttiense F1]|uniref:type II toxin-antitoxin system HicB family antitoxin n=1 Tax=Herbaspirillum huttiense TaxID=863372 RepID=UPI002886D352|nr:type II toxin-antitoxin system HicB family antitoxin [Herbaspirillum huttiense]MDT0355676.1 type II toxin-antitoxin system HicB family antitoxin [Herbaspirillum huttiense F1]
MKYPAHFEADAEAGGFVVTFRDIPEAITQGETEDEAFAMAADALLTSIDFYFEDKRPVPLPSPAKRGERLVSLPASVSSKVLLLNEMLLQKVAPSELARRLDTSRQEVNRLIDLNHATKIDRIEEALSALGKRLDLVVA